MLYDSNNISLDGSTSMAFTENVGRRFEAYGWEHILVEDGNNLNAISEAIEKGKKNTKQPTLIEVKTVIGYGGPNAGTSKVHGAPLGVDGVKEAKKNYGWNYQEDFFVPEEVQTRFHKEIVEKGEKAQQDWEDLFKEYQKSYPKLAKQFTDGFNQELPEGWEEDLPNFDKDYKAASRVTSKELIQSLSKSIPAFWGGSADLSSSNNTMVAAETDFEPDNYKGRNIWFGVREFAMAAAMNGIQLHGGTKVYGGTFFVFVDYLRPALRLAALQKLPVTYVLTHDSVAVGEDGPTHEPVEQLSSLRGMPNLQVIRPADANEAKVAWKLAIKSKNTPTALILTRQNLPIIAETFGREEEIAKGGYVLIPQKGDKPEGILIATGSEVDLVKRAQEKLWEKGHDVSVVSIPSFELFDKQSDSYKESVLPSEVVKRISVEMAATFGWEKYVGLKGKSMGINTFGASGKGEEVINSFGFTVDNIVTTFESL